MIQDIAPHVLNNAFKKIKAEYDSTVIAFSRNKVVISEKNGRAVFPAVKQIEEFAGNCDNRLVYAFSVDNKPVFLMLGELDGNMTASDFEFTEMRKLSAQEEKWVRLAAVTAKHLHHWYSEHRFCGCCGHRLGFSDNERAMICSECGNIQYPRISPVIMAAVTDGDRLLVTRYSGREYKGLALIAGFVEIGESVEAALEREVMEEVGVRVKNLRYFGSQPWGFSDSVISGFFADLDGSDRIKLDRNELSEAIWLKREEIPVQSTDISITAAMIEAFRKGDI